MGRQSSYSLDEVAVILGMPTFAVLEDILAGRFYVPVLIKHDSEYVCIDKDFFDEIYLSEDGILILDEMTRSANAKRLMDRKMKLFLDCVDRHKEQGEEE